MTAASDPLSRLPQWYWRVPYVGSRFPGSPAVRARPDLTEGANCQLFAYAVLREFGLAPPELRSSELWADRATTAPVPSARPLDLVLFNADATAWGAHVGVALDADRVLHLCAEIGRPVVWSRADFAARERYRTVVGVLRVHRCTTVD